MAGRSPAISNDSTRSVPPSDTGSKRYRHLVDGPLPCMMKANSLPLSAVTTSGSVLHRRMPRLLVPLNRAPGVGPVAPPIHAAHRGNHVARWLVEVTSSTDADRWRWVILAIIRSRRRDRPRGEETPMSTSTEAGGSTTVQAGRSWPSGPPGGEGRSGRPDHCNRGSTLVTQD